jgi:hypothetical protein
VVINDFDFVRIVLSPDKANPPLVVESDRVLTAPIALQRFEAVRRRNTQVLEPLRIVQEAQFSQCDNLNILRQPSTASPCPDYRRLVIVEADDHEG